MNHLANPNPSKRNRFKVGNNANPRGAGAHDPFIRKIKKLTNGELLELMNLIVQGDMALVHKINKDPNAPVIQAMIAAIVLRIANKGDMHALDALLNRLVGKSKEALHDATEDRGPRVIVHLPSNGRELVT